MLLKQIKKILICLFVILCIYVIYTNSKCVEPLSNVNFEVSLKPSQYYETTQRTCQHECRREGFWKKKRRWPRRRWRYRTVCGPVCTNNTVKHNEHSQTNKLKKFFIYEQGNNSPIYSTSFSSENVPYGGITQTFSVPFDTLKGKIIDKIGIKVGNDSLQFSSDGNSNNAGHMQTSVSQSDGCLTGTNSTNRVTSGTINNTTNKNMIFSGGVIVRDDCMAGSPHSTAISNLNE